MRNNQLTQRNETMTMDEIKEALLNRGWHEDYLDELNSQELSDLYDSGVTRDPENLFG